MDEKHIMVNLGDDRVKQISEVIGNKTCNKILDYLASKSATVTEISNDLKMPLNTVDYNIKKLVKSGLIEKATHWWSVKGKKMPAYRVSNKKIIISPKKKLSSAFLLTAGLTGLMAIGIRIFNPVFETVPNENIRSTPVTESAIFASEKAAEDTIFQSTTSAGIFSGVGPWGWFLIGAWLAIVLFMTITIFKERRGK